eukprot:2195924-Rhodomonas_salina.3
MRLLRNLRFRNSDVDRLTCRPSVALTDWCRSRGCMGFLQACAMLTGRVPLPAFASWAERTARLKHLRGEAFEQSSCAMPCPELTSGMPLRLDTPMPGAEDAENAVGSDHPQGSAPHLPPLALPRVGLLGPQRRCRAQGAEVLGQRIADRMLARAWDAWCDDNGLLGQVRYLPRLALGHVRY